MKITDEILLEAARQSFYETEDFDFGGWFGEVRLFAREIIELAQQVKPLEFVQDDDGDLVAKSPMGKFHVLKMVLSGFVYNGKSYPTEYEAIEAANEDYRKRVLSCLVWGGV